MGECPICGLTKCEGQPKCGLRYIARSPSREHGGFHENAILTAKQALNYIEDLETRLGLAHGRRNG
jgi:hypothetical protein